MQKNNFALITGAASGIGRAYALQLAARGCGLVLVDRSGEALDALAVEIVGAYDVQVMLMVVDLTTEGVADMLYRDIEQRGVEIDTLICNAGVLLFGGFATYSTEAINCIIDLHCKVATHLVHLFGRKMRTRGHGRILLMASATAWMPFPSISLYAATKSYLRCFAEALHDEWAADGVKVTVVCPGAVDTPLYNLDEKMRRRLLLWRVMHRPESIAKRGLRALDRGRKRLVPGFVTRLSLFLCRLCPSWLVRWAVRRKRVRRLLE